MTTKINVDGAIAVWNDDEDRWMSHTKDFEMLLNIYHEEHAPTGPSNPFPAGVAVEIAKRQFSDLKVIEIDKEPGYNPKAVY